MMVKVKICGITNVRDALWAVKSGADALGFIFFKGSARYVPPEKVRAIALSLPPFVGKVGVFVDEAPEVIEEIMDLCCLDYAQLHGYESPRVVARLKDRRVLKAIRVRTEEDIRDIQKYRVDGYVLDAYVRGLAGGTGRTFDWSLARPASQMGNIILAGGLTPDNVEEAIRAARPYAVDVSTGVEEEPGKKSKEFVDIFIQIAKSVEI